MANKLWLRYSAAALALALCAVAYVTYDDWRIALPSSLDADGATDGQAARQDAASAATRRKKEKHGAANSATSDLAATALTIGLHPAMLAAAAAPAATLSTESDEALRERMHAVQESRQARLRAACTNDSKLRTGRLGTVFNLKSLNLTYCCIAKCASTTFKGFLDRVTGHRCIGHDVHQCTQSIFPRAASRHDFMSNSVLIVRNPWVRLVSSYTNKFFYDPGSVARPCYKQHGKSMRGHSRLTFAEYIECILHNLDEGQPLNAHVAPISWHCSPCSNRFTYIATLETFVDDLKYLILSVLPKTKTPAEYWKAAELGTVIPHKAERANKTDPYEQHFRSLSSQQMDRIVAVYRADAILYGYPLHPLSKAASHG